MIVKEKKATNVQKGTFTVLNDKGLHTRPSTELVKCACGFKSTIRLKHQENNVNAKSLLGILMLAATKGTKIQIEAEGEDGTEAIAAIQALAEQQFNIQY